MIFSSQTLYQQQP